MSKSDAAENSILKLIFQAVNWTSIADNTATSPATFLYVSLHTADPGEAGTQTTNEISYTGYGRVAVPRTSGGWTVTADTVSPVNTIPFGTMSGGAGGTATHAAVGLGNTGVSGVILYSGALSPTIAVSGGVTPQITTGSTITET